ncbi:MAG TPA: sugar ABC transporter permease [Chloroflexota bacterium]|nr:sugar ABC transporter permease [Chloroflexota bacterium]
MDRLWLALAAIVGVPVVTCGYVVLAERFLGLLAPRVQRRLRPWFWLAPALVLLTVFLVYPTIDTLRLSFLDAQSTEFVGFANYAALAVDSGLQTTVRNNLLWLVVFTAVTVALGLVIAVLTDRRRYESVAKAIVFLPMAVSFVGAGVIWKFVYAFEPAGTPQTGIVNAALVATVPGFQPQAWLIQDPINNLALIAVGVWVWTGFCTVILSAALKGLSREVLEAARVDGANAVQIFRLVTVPLIAPTIAVVTTTMVIFALKAFDIVYVMTSGNFNTDVLANRMYTEMFTNDDFGRAAAIAVILLVAVAPVMAINVQRFRRQEEQN